MSELSKTIKEQKINLTGDDLLLLYEVYTSPDVLSPAMLANKSNRMLQQIIFQLKSLENRNFIVLDSNSIDIGQQNISLAENSKLPSILNNINNKLVDKVKQQIANMPILI